MKKILRIVNSKTIIYSSLFLLTIIIIFYALLTNSTVFDFLSKDLQRILVYILTLLACVSIVMSFLSFRGMMKSMKHIIDGAERLANGELNVSSKTLTSEVQSYAVTGQQIAPYHLQTIPNAYEIEMVLHLPIQFPIP